MTGIEITPWNTTIPRTPFTVLTARKGFRRCMAGRVTSIFRRGCIHFLPTLDQRTNGPGSLRGRGTLGDHWFFHRRSGRRHVQPATRRNSRSHSVGMHLYWIGRRAIRPGLASHSATRVGFPWRLYSGAFWRSVRHDNRRSHSGRDWRMGRTAQRKAHAECTIGPIVLPFQPVNHKTILVAFRISLRFDS